jgi:predicted PurR-regulated permease PerM
MFKNPFVQAFVAAIIGLCLLGPLGALLAVAIWCVVYATKH